MTAVRSRQQHATLYAHTAAGDRKRTMGIYTRYTYVDLADRSQSQQPNFANRDGDPALGGKRSSSCQNLGGDQNYVKIGRAHV